MLLPHAVIVAALTTSLATACSLCPMCFLEAVQLRPACIPAQTLLRSSRLANGSFPASVLARAGVCNGALAAGLQRRTYSHAESRERQTDDSQAAQPACVSDTLLQRRPKVVRFLWFAMETLFGSTSQLVRSNYSLMRKSWKPAGKHGFHFHHAIQKVCSLNSPRWCARLPRVLTAAKATFLKPVFLEKTTRKNLNAK